MRHTFEFKLSPQTHAAMKQKSEAKNYQAYHALACKQGLLHFMSHITESSIIIIITYILYIYLT